jgi:hypothetical protein
MDSKISHLEEGLAYSKHAINVIFTITIGQVAVSTILRNDYRGGRIKKEATR